VTIILSSCCVNHYVMLIKYYSKHFMTNVLKSRKWKISISRFIWNKNILETLYIFRFLRIPRKISKVFKIFFLRSDIFLRYKYQRITCKNKNTSSRWCATDCVLDFHRCRRDARKSFNQWSFCQLGLKILYDISAKSYSPCAMINILSFFFKYLCTKYLKITDDNFNSAFCGTY